jgi:deazaflavin-dependent oxidoreductase (nitroreductase family)
VTTIGRKSGQPRTVELRLIYYRGCFYASSSRITGKHWCQNLLKNNSVRVTARGETKACSARQVADDALRRTILSFRGSPADMTRVVFEFCPEQRG